MTSWQRKRGMTARFYPRVLQTNRRGEQQYVVDMTAVPVVLPIAQWWLRSSRAEVPGDQTIDVRRLIVKANIPDIDVWSVVVFDGPDGEDRWDVIAPPQYHHGTRHTRHWSIDVRRRPDELDG